MENDFGAPIPRRTIRAQDVDDSAALAMELEEEHDAYVSSGRVPWRGLSGHDPLDDLTDDEFRQRQWEDWHDASEVDEERPQRNRPSGRGVDIVPPSVGEVTVRVDPAIRAAFAAKQAAAEPQASWEVEGGTVTVVGALKLWRGPCAQCSREFEQTRPGDQKCRWKKTCSDVCAAAWKRDRARERKQKQRERERGRDAA
ncbi:hypothetical protein [Streptomyces sp. AC512_CC834]|uniref:hypothetical protein n=1 Tax=Streptomyces sp. AC512_CC834 TaxID=2823691 RepID=UPI001C26E1ED|nr:hypothetical protein [Streptomyces sp. AC512_CC834]